MDSLVTEVSELLDRERAIRRQLKTAGVALLKRLTRDRSIRSVASDVEVSHAYLSRVLLRQQAISPEVFVRLSKLKGAF